jgi:hypothetical protein
MESVTLIETKGVRQTTHNEHFRLRVLCAISELNRSRNGYYADEITIGKFFIENNAPNPKHPASSARKPGLTPDCPLSILKS